jgi:hypothetical protein
MKAESIKATTTILRLKNGLQSFTFPTSTQVLHHVDPHSTIHKLRLQMARINIQIQIKLSLCRELRPWTPRISWASILEAEGGALSLVHQWQWFDLNGTGKSNQLWSLVELPANLLSSVSAIQYYLYTVDFSMSNSRIRTTQIQNTPSLKLTFEPQRTIYLRIDGPAERNATRTAVRGQVNWMHKIFLNWGHFLIRLGCGLSIWGIWT